STGRFGGAIVTAVRRSDGVICVPLAAAAAATTTTATTGRRRHPRVGRPGGGAGQRNGGEELDGVGVSLRAHRGVAGLTHRPVELERLGAFPAAVGVGRHAVIIAPATRSLTGSRCGMLAACYHDRMTPSRTWPTSCPRCWPPWAHAASTPTSNCPVTEQERVCCSSTDSAPSCWTRTPRTPRCSASFAGTTDGIC